MKIVLGEQWYGRRRIIEQPCIACKTQILYAESWCYGLDNGYTFFGLCGDCCQWMIKVNFK